MKQALARAERPWSSAFDVKAKAHERRFQMTLDHFRYIPSFYALHCNVSMDSFTLSLSALDIFNSRSKNEGLDF